MKPDQMLAEIDGVIASVRERLDALTTARDLIAKAYAMPVAVTPAAPLRVPVKDSAAKSSRNAAASRAASDGRQKQRDDAKAIVLAWLKKRTEPASQSDIAAGTNLSIYRVQGAVDALVHDGEIVRRGKTSQSRVGLPAVMSRPAKEEL